MSKTLEQTKDVFLEAIDAYKLIQPGDKVLAAISGGKDSLSMLRLLDRLKKIPGREFKLYACHITTDFRCGSCISESALKGLFKKLGIKYVFKHIKVLDKNGKTNCFWCSWNRRKCLFQTADKLGCKKVAFGHHQDDIIETTLLNLFFHGEISSMKPRQELFKGKITIIRPLALATEGLISTYARANKIPEQLYRCPYGSQSKRKLVKGIIKELCEEFPRIDIRGNLFKTITSFNSPGQK